MLHLLYLFADWILTMTNAKNKPLKNILYRVIYTLPLIECMWHTKGLAYRDVVSTRVWASNTHLYNFYKTDKCVLVVGPTSEDQDQACQYICTHIMSWPHWAETETEHIWEYYAPSPDSSYCCYCLRRSKKKNFLKEEEEEGRWREEFIIYN